MVKEPQHRVLAIVFASVALATLTLDAMAETREVHIIKKGNNFFFKEGDAAIEIQKGDTVRWLVQEGTEREHHLRGKPPTNGFEETKNFDENTKPPVERTFSNPGALNYQCIFHPTMQGTISVK